MMWGMVGAVTIAILVGTFTVGPIAMAVGAGVLVLALLAALRPKILLPVAFILVFATTPHWFPSLIAVGPVSVYLYEIPLVLGAAWAAVKFEAPRLLKVAVLSLIFILILGLGIATQRGGITPQVFADIRPFIMMVIAFAAAGMVARTDVPRLIIRILPWLLWSSAALVLAASLFGFELSGRVEAASLTDLTDATQATRVTTPTNFLSVVVLCVVVSLAIQGRAQFRDTAVFWAPAAVIVLLAFSRNALVGLVVAVLATLLFTRRFQALVVTATLAAVVVVSFAGLMAIAPTLRQFPAGAWLATAIDSYSGRVLDGLTAETRAVDGSALFREREENALMLPWIPVSPLFGHGWGFAYKAPVGPPGYFLHDQAPFYAHQYYLWLLIKVGAVGLLLFAVAFLLPFMQTLVNPSTARVALCSALAAMLVISTVAPLGNGISSSALLGGVAGLIVGGIGLPPGGDQARRFANSMLGSRRAPVRV